MAFEAPTDEFDACTGAATLDRPTPRTTAIGALPEDKLLPLLRGVVCVRSGEWKAFCPIHKGGNEDHPSLAITKADDGKLLLHCPVCGKGVRAAQFCMAVGITQSELYPDGLSRGRRGKKSRIPANAKKVAEFIYHDMQGAIVCKVVRFEWTENGRRQKTFDQYRPNGVGGWINSVRGITKVLFRLRELIAASPNATVFIVEGEGVADRLASLGFVVTTNIGGAGKWLASYSASLAGRDVVLLPDNDAPGSEHARDVAAKLAGVARSVKIVLLPGLQPKGDVSDWLDAGGTAEKLGELVAENPSISPIASSLDSAMQLIAAPSPDDDDEICNARDEGEAGVSPLSMEAIVGRINRRTGGRIRRVDKLLFAHDEGASHVRYLESTPSFFAYLGEFPPPPNFRRLGKCHSQAEVFASFQHSTPDYVGIETVPHEPKLAGHYYACDFPQPGSGTLLNKLVAHFNPASDVDRHLITAYFATLFWGGRGGSRPAFGITSDFGRGAGKTALVQKGGELCGGLIELSADEDVEEIKKRLLSPEGMTKRLAMLDNVKRRCFSSAELESLITAPTVSGRRLYVGEGSRPNSLTWAVTMNGGAYSTDLAQRTVFIKLDRPAYAGNWEESTRDFIDANRRGIIGDIIALLRSDGADLARYSRWGSWERGVLSKLPNPSEIQSVILERQQVADVEDEETDLIEEFFAAELTRYSFDPETDVVLITSGVACKWLSKALNDRFTVTAASRSIKQKIGESKISKLVENKTKSYGRGFIWFGSEASPSAPIKTNLEMKLEEEEFARHRSGF